MNGGEIAQERETEFMTLFRVKLRAPYIAASNSRSEAGAIIGPRRHVVFAITSYVKRMNKIKPGDREASLAAQGQPWLGRYGSTPCAEF